MIMLKFLHILLMDYSSVVFFLKNFFVGHMSLFAGPLIPLFWTSGDICPGFQSQGGFPRLRAYSPATDSPDSPLV